VSGVSGVTYTSLAGSELEAAGAGSSVEGLTFLALFVSDPLGVIPAGYPPFIDGFVDEIFYPGEFIPLYEDAYIILAGSAVPIPAAAWLFGSALVCLVGVGRRKKAQV
jgi:hypothetical protein